MHVMLDLETLGTKPGSAIVSIGACVFNMDGVQERFYNTIDVTKPFGNRHLAMDPSTVVWWMSQAQEARAVFADKDRVPTYEAINSFRHWWEDMEQKYLSDAQYIWCHGAGFDAPILEAAYVAINQIAPFKFYNIRDTRTLYALTTISPDRSKGTHHNALDDAIAQAEAVIAGYKALGKTL